MDFPEYLKTIQAQLQKGDISKTSSSTQLVTTTQEVSAKKGQLKFMLVSTHLQQFTGYSRISNGLINELSKNSNIHVIHYGFQRGTKKEDSYRPYPSNVDVIDAAELENPPVQGFGFSQLPDTIRKKKPHIVMIYNDLSVVSKFIEEIRKSGIERNFKLWVYVDQVYNCQLQGYLDVLNRDCDRIFAFTNDWKKCLKFQGINRPIDVLHHAFESKLYFPLPKDFVRKQLNLPQDAFIILSLNRNTPRKRYDILVMAFVELIAKNPQKAIHLLCISDRGEKGGYWLFEIFVRELKLRGLPIEPFANRLMISSQDMSFRDEDINLFYNVADIGISTSDGEGWGLCNFEQMGVGVPQVVPAIGGFKEFCNAQNSVMVKPKSRYYLPMAYSSVGGEAEACDPTDICLGIEEYLFDSKKREEFGKAAREKVLEYTWPKATELLIKRILSAKTELEDEGEL